MVSKPPSAVTTSVARDSRRRTEHDPSPRPALGSPVNTGFPVLTIHVRFAGEVGPVLRVVAVGRVREGQTRTVRAADDERGTEDVHAVG